MQCRLSWLEDKLDYIMTYGMYRGLCVFVRETMPQNVAGWQLLLHPNTLTSDLDGDQQLLGRQLNCRPKVCLYDWQ